MRYDTPILTAEYTNIISAGNKVGRYKGFSFYSFTFTLTKDFFVKCF